MKRDLPSVKSTSYSKYKELASPNTELTFNEIDDLINLNDLGINYSLSYRYDLSSYHISKLIKYNDPDIDLNIVERYNKLTNEDVDVLISRNNIRVLNKFVLKGARITKEQIDKLLSSAKFGYSINIQLSYIHNLTHEQIHKLLEIDHPEISENILKTQK